jgi:C1A family cysteine protease
MPDMVPQKKVKSIAPPAPIERASVFPKLGKGLGHLSSDADARDYRVGTLLGALRGLANENLQLTQFVAKVRNQKQTNSCTGHAVVAASEVRLKRMGVNYTGSPIAAYTLGRELAKHEVEEPLQDEGAYPRDVMRAVSEWGLPKEWEWPFDAKRINQELPVDVLQGGSRHKLTAFYRIDAPGTGRIQQAMQAIEHGYPFVFALKIDREFMDLTNTNCTLQKLSGNRVGGHMMACLGYTTIMKTGKRLFRVLNSWGTEWADGGFCWLHEDVFQDASASDFFVNQVA